MCCTVDQVVFQLVTYVHKLLLFIDFDFINQQPFCSEVLAEYYFCVLECVNMILLLRAMSDCLLYVAFIVVLLLLVFHLFTNEEGWIADHAKRAAS